MRGSEIMILLLSIPDWRMSYYADYLPYIVADSGCLITDQSQIYTIEMFY